MPCSEPTTVSICIGPSHALPVVPMVTKLGFCTICIDS